MLVAPGQHGPTSSPQDQAVYALVSYLPSPLRDYLDALRLDIAPGCNPHAHVTVLPPRNSPASWPEISTHLAGAIARFGSFEVELGGVRQFPETGVVYIELRRGDREFRLLHDALNVGPLAFAEPFPYHPHLTLAQEIPAGEEPAVFERAARRWREYGGVRGFRVNSAVFVRNESGNCWLDLQSFPLESPVQKV